ncbi:hypothetical protein ACQW02_20600 [Humitalea sp. 24SJ18S-53]|uniref:hypothetical protein n=1 Tax=Humitalea sp. 24SJ18S-53 TaxID=3422307 RepID=UPI003D67480B
MWSMRRGAWFGMMGRAGIAASLIGGGCAGLAATPANAIEVATAPTPARPTVRPAPARPRAAAPARRPPQAEPPLCDAPGEARIHRLGSNLAELEDPDATAILQHAMQLCVSTAPQPDRTPTGRPVARGPVWRG